MKIYLQTLGCKVNQYETQAMETLLSERGHSITEDSKDSDAIIVNTCAVTAESGRKSRQAIRHLRSDNPDAILAVCGCFSQIEPSQIADLGVDVVFGSGQRREFIQAVEEEFTLRHPVLQIDKALTRHSFEELPSGHLHGRTRAMLKIQDGCCNFCTYCIIPYARGPVRSLPLEAVRRESRMLAKAGYKEIVITGIEIASYGIDFRDGTSLTDAICTIGRETDGVRLRLGSLEPRIITEEFCRTVQSLPGMCPHFHLSLQSGCDTILTRMHRKYNTERFYEAVCLLRRYFPGCGITTDLIVGFPGETPKDHEETLDFLRKCRFSAVHIFPYSPRPGTPAAAMGGQVTRNEKKVRADSAAAVAKETKSAYLRSCIGSIQQVLFEQEKNGYSLGHAENYCPVKVRAIGLRKQIIPIIITAVEGENLIGQLPK